MSKNYIIGFPRIGEKRELKFALESFWSQKSDLNELNRVANALKIKHWSYQKAAGIEYISSNDFSFYDNMLDMAVLLNAIPQRFKGLKEEELYFSMARGNTESVAMEMTKWFNTNYHYIVPELSLEDEYKLNATKIINEYKEAKKLGLKTKINIIGPITFLGLSKRVDGGETYELYSKIIPVYEDVKGWNCDLTKLTSYDEAPVELKDYVKYLEGKLEVPIKVVSVGPDRKQTLNNKVLA